DGIRDFHVTGVQTCALPIYSSSRELRSAAERPSAILRWRSAKALLTCGQTNFIVNRTNTKNVMPCPIRVRLIATLEPPLVVRLRSEERRVGKEGRARRATQE